MLYANTDDGSSALWVCDDDGIVVDNISYSFGERTLVLERINENYGTSFTGWSDNEIALQVGANIPEWAEYEKIERTYFLYKTTESSGIGFPGYVENNIIHMLVQPDTLKIYVVTMNDGKVVSSTAYEQSLEEQVWQDVNNEFGNISQNQVLEEIQIESGTTLVNWQDYDVIVHI